MTKYTRRKLFYLLVAAFLMIAPLLIAYALGYTLDLAKRDVKKTGGIFIKSKVPRLAIFLNGSFAKETSLISGGALLTDITPGTYLLRIEKADHGPWSKTVTVVPEIVTELRGILLIPHISLVATTTKKELAPFTATSTPSAYVFSLDKKGNMIRKSGDKSDIAATGVNSFAVLKTQVFFVDKNGFLARLNPDTKVSETIARPGFYLSENPMKFILSPRGEVVLIDSAGGIFFLDSANTINPSGSEALNIRFDSKGEKMLIHKERSVEVRWLADNRYQPFQKKGDEEIILRLDSPISDARWFYKDDAHIVIRTADGIFLTELDGRGGRNTFELLSGKTDELLTGPEIPESIFFRKGKIWYKIEL